MSQYRMDYVTLHDDAGKPVYRTSTTIVDFVPVLTNFLAYWFFVIRVNLDAEKLNVSPTFDFYINRAKHYKVLYEKKPVGLLASLKFHSNFLLKMYAG